MAAQVILKKLESQEDWEDDSNIQAIFNAIESGQINTVANLLYYIGDQSKKKRRGPMGNLYTVPAADLIQIKKTSRIHANAYEHEIIDTHTNVLKTIPKIQTPGGYDQLPKSDADGLTEEQTKILTKNEQTNFTGRVYDFAVGKALYDGVIEKYLPFAGRNRERAIKDLKRDLANLARFRDLENQMFARLIELNPQEQNDSEGHIVAARKEASNQRQLDLYVFGNEKALIKEAKNYQKYLKYKAKYLALKKQLEQKN